MNQDRNQNDSSNRRKEGNKKFRAMRSGEEWKFGNWNIRGINGKEEELIDEFEKTDMKFIALTETKKKGQGLAHLRNGHLLLYSGVDQEKWAQEGVGCLIHKDSIGSALNWNFSNERIMSVKWKLPCGKSTTIFIVYGPNESDRKEDKENFWQLLQDQVDKVDGYMIVGDLNGRVGNDYKSNSGVIGRYGEQARNSNGNLIIDFCIMNGMKVANTLFQHKEVHKITREVKSRKEKSTIDLLLIRDADLHLINDVRVRRGYEIGSDHYLVEIRVKGLMNNKEKKREEFVNIRSYKLQCEEIKANFQTKIGKQMQLQKLMEMEEVEQLWNKFKNILLESARKVCGMVRYSGKRKHTPWWNTEIKEAVTEKKKAWKLFLRTGNDKDDNNYKEKRRNVNYLIKEAKRKAWEEFGQRMEEQGKGNSKLLYRTLKNLGRDNKTAQQYIRNKEGAILTTEDERKTRWMEHYSELFEVCDITDRGNEEEQLELNPENEIQQMELTQAIKKMKIGKAAGYDEIKPEFIKCMGEEGNAVLLRIINMAWATKSVPEEWKLAVIIPILKKGDATSCSNYRGISLLSVAGKIYERILESRVRNQIEISLAENQAGFRPGRGAHDWIFAIRQLSERFLSGNGEFFLCAMDLEKAFDTLPRNKIWETLASKGIQQDLLNAVKSLYDKTDNVIRIENSYTEKFRTQRGVRQGSILSPLLFITVMDEMARRANKVSKGVQVGVSRLKPIIVKEFLYADDLVITAQNKTELEKSIKLWQGVLNEYGMNINRKKTEVMVITKNEENINLIIDGEPINVTRELKYLGAIIDSRGSIEADVENRIKSTSRLFHALKTSFLSKKEVSKQTKIKVYKTVFIPILTYGSESWVLTRRLKSKVTAMEMRMLRRIEGVTRRDKIRNETIREKLHVTAITDIIKEKQLSWFGHMVRMKDDSLVKEIWEAGWDKKKRRGRPKKTWNQEIAQILTSRGTNWNEARTKTRNRKEWKKFCKTEQTSTP